MKYRDRLNRLATERNANAHKRMIICFSSKNKVY